MIEVTHLVKQYGNHLAVKDLSFTVEDGKIYGLLGPNGAGKSTTMNIITGCLAPTSGSVTIGGYDIFEKPNQAKRLIGYLPELPPLYPDMTPREYLCFVAKLKGVKGAAVKEQVDHVCEVTQIVEMQHRLIKNLSKGYRQRVGIAQAILGSPQVIILDEPTVGLDPKQIIEIRDLIKSLGETHTVILSSHILSEVQAVCDHIMIINKGELVASDAPENLEKLFKNYSLSVTVRGDKAQAEALMQSLPGTPAFRLEKAEEGTVRILIAPENEQDCREQLFMVCSKAQLPILDMRSEKASLEDIFLEFTQGDDTQETAETTAGKEG